MKKGENDAETVAVPRSVLEGLLGKVETLEARLRSSGKGEPAESP